MSDLVLATERVLPGDECPICGEADMDHLELIDSRLLLFKEIEPPEVDTIFCLGCGFPFMLQYEEEEPVLRDVGANLKMYTHLKGLQTYETLARLAGLRCSR